MMDLYGWFWVFMVDVDGFSVDDDDAGGRSDVLVLGLDGQRVMTRLDG